MAKKTRDLTHPCGKTGYLRYDFVIDLKRHSGSTGTKDKKQAERIARAVWEKARDEAAERRKAVGRLDMRWKEACSDYFEQRGDYVSRERDIATMRWISERIGGDRYVSTFDHATLGRLVTERRAEFKWGNPANRKVANCTVNGLTHFVRKVLTRARVELGCHLSREPRYGKLLLPTSPRRREMMVAEEIRIRRVATPDLLDVSQFVLLTGMRKSAALLLWEQVHLEEGVMHIHSKGKFQEVAIIPEVHELLERALANKTEGTNEVWTWYCNRTFKNPRTGKIYIEGRRYPYTPQGLWSAWKKTGRRACVKNLHVHDLRKTFGARIVREEGNIAAAQVALNHSKISMTAEHYSHITPQDIRNVVARTVAKTRARLELAAERALFDQR